MSNIRGCGDDKDFGCNKKPDWCQDLGLQLCMRTILLNSFVIRGKIQTPLAYLRWVRTTAINTTLSLWTSARHWQPVQCPSGLMTKALTCGLSEAALWPVQGFSLPLETAGCSGIWRYTARCQRCAQVKWAAVRAPASQPPPQSGSQEEGPVWTRSLAMTSTARQAERCPPVPLARMVWEWEDDGKDRKRKRWTVRRGRREKKKGTRGNWPRMTKRLKSSSFHCLSNFLSATTTYFTFSNDGQYSLYLTIKLHSKLRFSS